MSLKKTHILVNVAYIFHSFDRLWCGKWKKLDFGHAILRYLIYFHFGNFAKIFVQLYHGKLTPVPIHSVARLVLLNSTEIVSLAKFCSRKNHAWFFVVKYLVCFLANGKSLSI